MKKKCKKPMTSKKLRDIGSLPVSLKNWYGAILYEVALTNEKNVLKRENYISKDMWNLVALYALSPQKSKSGITARIWIHDVVRESRLFFMPLRKTLELMVLGLRAAASLQVDKEADQISLSALRHLRRAAYKESQKTTQSSLSNIAEDLRSWVNAFYPRLLHGGMSIRQYLQEEAVRAKLDGLGKPIRVYTVL